MLIVLAAASTIVLRNLEEAEDAARGKRGHEPDFFMEDFESTIMDTDGEPVRIVRAKQMLHFPDTRTRATSTVTSGEAVRTIAPSR